MAFCRRVLCAVPFENAEIGAARKEVKVSCKTDPVCEHWYLHRLRKTTATRWMNAGINVRKIQKWLGHKSLETTEIYLGAGTVDANEQTKLNRAADGD